CTFSSLWTLLSVSQAPCSYDCSLSLHDALPILLCRLLRIPYVPILRGGSLPVRIQRSPRMSKMLFKAAAINVSPSSYLKKAFEKDRKSTRLNSSHVKISYAVFCL